MTKEYGALLAQVIPVLLLALLLELRAILVAAREEWARHGISGQHTPRNLFKAIFDLRSYLPRRRRHKKRKWGTWKLRGYRTSVAGHKVRFVKWAIPRVTTDDELKVSRLGPVDAFGFILIHGGCMLWMGRSELVALAIANGKNVPGWEAFLLHLGILLSLIQVAIIPIGLEVYAKFAGDSWRKADWRFTIVVGVVATTLLSTAFLYFRI